MEKCQRHLDAMDHNPDGWLLVGSSSLTHRLWKGKIYYIENCSDSSVDLNKCQVVGQLESGIADIKWIGRTRRLVASCDSGAVELWELSEERDVLNCVTRPIEHDNIASSVSLNSTANRLVSASYDHSISVWDVEEFQPISHYKGHYDIVWSAAFHASNPDIFVSCSQDGRLLVWDLRLAKPASIMENTFLPSLPTCVSWQPGCEHSVAIGTETGHVLLQDCRVGVGTPAVVQSHNRLVYRLAFAPHRNDILASVSNDCTSAATAFSDSSGTVVFRNTKHQDFVQGLSWNPTSRLLYTCSWDGTVCGSAVEMANEDNENSVVMTNGNDSTDKIDQ